MDGERIYVGILRLKFVVPSSRSRKDRRQVLRSFRDRVRHRYTVSIHELDDPDVPTQQSFIVTTGGNNRRTIQGVLDEIADLARSGAQAWPSSVDLEVFRWHPKGPTLSTFLSENQEFDDE